MGSGARNTTAARRTEATAGAVRSSARAAEEYGGRVTVFR